MTYELSEADVEDIDAVLERSVVDFGPLQTGRYFTSLKRCLELLGANPMMGNSADDVRPGYRRFTHRSHVIFYRETDDRVLVVRVLHRSMDAESHIE